MFFIKNKLLLEVSGSGFLSSSNIKTDMVGLACMYGAIGRNSCLPNERLANSNWWCMGTFRNKMDSSYTDYTMQKVPYIKISADFFCLHTLTI